MNEDQTEKLLVTKKELASKILNCALTTLSSLIDKYPDFPIHKRGAKGVEWLFDAVAVSDFLEQKRTEERKAVEAKTEFFNQFSLPVDVPELQGHGELTPTQRVALAKARLAERKLALETGMLVSKAEMRQAMAGPVAQLGHFLDALAGKVARRHGLSETVTTSMQSMINEQHRQFVREINDILDMKSEQAARDEGLVSETGHSPSV